MTAAFSPNVINFAMFSLQAKVTEFGINKENMFEFWDVSLSYMYNHCFLKQTGREGGNPKNITRSKKLIHSNNRMKWRGGQWSETPEQCM